VERIGFFFWWLSWFYDSSNFMDGMGSIAAADGNDRQLFFLFHSPGPSMLEITQGLTCSRCSSSTFARTSFYLRAVCPMHFLPIVSAISMLFLNTTINFQWDVSKFC